VATEGSANVGAFFVSGSDHAQGAFFLGSAGFSLLGAVYTNAHPYWNIGSPYVTAGVGHRLDRDWVGTLSVVADYSVRWGHTPNVPSVGLLIGVGDVGYAGQATPPPMSDREVIRAIGAPNATPNEGDARRE
jgi:hypothetical protein